MSHPNRPTAEPRLEVDNPPADTHTKPSSSSADVWRFLAAAAAENRAGHPNWIVASAVALFTSAAETCERAVARSSSIPAPIPHRKTTYEIAGAEVSGYRVGPYLAIRDAALDDHVRNTQDRKRAIEQGRWVLEHVPTGQIVCRGFRRADVLEIARLVTDEQQALYLASTDPSEIVRAVRDGLPAFLAAVMEQRAETTGYGL